MNGPPYYLVGGTESTLGNIEVVDVQNRFAAQIQKYFPNNPVEFYSLDRIRKGLHKQVGLAKKVLGEHSFVVTLSSLYYPNADAHISCTRMVDTDKNSLGISHRPGANSLLRQVRMVKRLAGSRPIIVVDDTLFHGETLTLLAKLGFKFQAVAEYFTEGEAVSRLESEGVRVFSVCELISYVDVMPIHDFVPIMPNCGKVVGLKSTGGQVHHRGYPNHSSWSLPYIAPYIKADLVTKWASIPWDFAFDFSAFAIEQSIFLAERLGKKGIHTLRDMSKAQTHRVSIPYLGNFENQMDLELSVILRRAVHRNIA